MLCFLLICRLTLCCFPFWINTFSFSRLVSSWSGVCEETAEVVSGSQPADQHQRTEGHLHSPAPEPLTQPPGRCGGARKQRSAPHTGPESQQPDGGTNKQTNVQTNSCSWSLKELLLMSLFSVQKSLETVGHCCCSACTIPVPCHL